MRRALRQAGRSLLDLLLPPVCPGCEEYAPSLCRVCDQHLQRRPIHGCPRCGEAGPGPGQPCGSDHRDFTHVAQLVAPYAYAGTGGALVRRFKLDGDLGAGRWLLRAMANACRQQLALPRNARPILVSVPLHAHKRRQRGFDQACWLAAGLAARLAIEPADGVLVRVRATLPQADPRVASRAANMAGAFAVRRPGRVSGRGVLLVDDVLTSGATARECAAVLRGAGAQSVTMVVACRS